MARQLPLRASPSGAVGKEGESRRASQSPRRGAVKESWLCRLLVRKRLCNPLTRPASRATLPQKARDVGLVSCFEAGAHSSVSGTASTLLVVVLIPCFEVGAVHRQLRSGRRRPSSLRSSRPPRRGAMNESRLCRLLVRKRLCNPLTRPASRDSLSPKGA